MQIILHWAAVDKLIMWHCNEKKKRKKRRKRIERKMEGKREGRMRFVRGVLVDSSQLPSKSVPQIP